MKFLNINEAVFVIFSEGCDVVEHFIRIVLMKENPALEVERRELFEFGHEVHPEKLKEMISLFVEKSDSEKLKLVVNVLRAIVR